MQSIRSAWSRASIVEKWLLLSLAVVSLFGYFFNLGLFPLTADEGIRSTVALEMMLSDNYVVPTIGGDFYYRKTPLYNWLIAACFAATGSFSEFVFRLPSVLPLFFFGATIWLIVRRELGNRVGLVAGFGFILCGRMLVYASFLGHIDIFFSWLSFMGIYSCYFFFRKEQWWRLFLVTYFIGALGVLMKGLPSLLFIAITLLTWFIYKRQFRKLFHVAHFAGIALLVIIVGGYFYLYSLQADPAPYVEALVDQSSQRTFVEKSWLESVSNLFLFPLEQWAHLLPTSLILLFAFRKGMRKVWMSSDFTAFTLLVLLTNVIPYWLSPGTYPRYLFMLYPMILILGAHAYWRNKESMSVMKKIVEGALGLGGIALLGSFFGIMFADKFDFIHHRTLTAVILALITLVVLIVYQKFSAHRMLGALLLFAIFRVGFDFFVVPYRVQSDQSGAVMQKQNCEDLIRITEGSTLYRLNKTPINPENIFYLSREKGEIISRQDSMIDLNAFYIAHPRYLKEVEYHIIHKFNIRWENKELWLIKPGPDPNAPVSTPV